MKLIIIIGLMLSLISCIDARRSEQLERINQLSEQLDETSQLLNAELIDTLQSSVRIARGVKSDIKEHFGEDTLTMEEAIQLDAYTEYMNEFEHLQTIIPVLQKNLGVSATALSSLKRDIEMEAGNRAHYDHQLQEEEEKALKLIAQIDSLVGEKNQSLTSFNDLHNKLSDFSLKLVQKKLEQ